MPRPYESGETSGRAGRARNVEKATQLAGLQRVFGGVAAEANRFLVQVVDGLQVTDGLILGTHENAVRDGGRVLQANAGEQRRVTDPGRGEEDALALGQVVGEVNLGEL